jgi:hypothetical protein
MSTHHRFAATAAVVLFALAAPAASASPVEPPAEEQWPPVSTHGAFRPLPPAFSEPQTFPACGSEVTISLGDVDTTQYRALVTAEGDTVVEYRGEATVDITRASDGATLDEVAVDDSGVETYSADGLSVTYDWPGTAVVVAFDKVEAEAFAQAGLPEAFLYLSGTLTETVTFASAPGPGEELPPVASAEILENSTEHVFDLCELLDQAAEGTTEEAAPSTSSS